MRPAVKELLLQRQADIVAGWFELIVQTYPRDAALFLKREQNPFANPAGSAMREAVAALFQGLLDNQPAGQLAQALDSLIRIRAVQDFPPSRAVAVILDLKDVVRKTLHAELQQPGMLAHWWEFETRVDQLALQAFDRYQDCRKQVYELRVDEIKRRVGWLLKKMNWWNQDLELEPPPPGDGSKELR